MNAQRYPLSWPVGWTRTPDADRRRANFQTYRSSRTAAIDGSMRPVTERHRVTNAQATTRLQNEIDRLGGVDALMSTNLRVRLDGVPVGNQGEPADPGVAVYFTLQRQALCLACDRWTRVADNIAAIAAHIDALRRIERYGVGRLEQAFRGYMALPSTAREWWTVLGVAPHATISEVEAAFRRMALEHHPDRGGDGELMARLTEARDIARRALRVN